MEIGQIIRNTREGQKLSQKEVALSINMDQSQYSKIEKGKTDPTYSTISRIANALNITVSDLFVREDELDINSYDKGLIDKIKLISLLDEEERIAIYKIIDGLLIKRKLRDSLSNALNMAS